MIVGTVREVKNHEYRVGLTPESVNELIAHGHAVVVESGAGDGIGASDEDYCGAGATIVALAREVFERAELVVKVKEPQERERKMLHEGQVLFAYLHLAPDPQQTADLIASGAIGIAYETVTDANGGLPLLKPMSQVAGRMSIQAGATALEKANGGRGVLLGGVPGVLPAKVTIIGGGIVGLNAAQMASGLGADVTILDRNPDVLERLCLHFEARAKTRFSNRSNIAETVAEADLVIGAVLIPGAAAPKLVTTDMLETMKRGAVLVDVAIDDGRDAPNDYDPTKFNSGDIYIFAHSIAFCAQCIRNAFAETPAPNGDPQDTEQTRFLITEGMKGGRGGLGSMEPCPYVEGSPATPSGFYLACPSPRPSLAGGLSGRPGRGGDAGSIFVYFVGNRDAANKELLAQHTLSLCPSVCPGANFGPTLGSSIAALSNFDGGRPSHLAKLRTPSYNALEGAPNRTSFLPEGASADPATLTGQAGALTIQNVRADQALSVIGSLLTKIDSSDQYDLCAFALHQIYKPAKSGTPPGSCPGSVSSESFDDLPDPSGGSLVARDYVRDFMYDGLRRREVALTRQTPALLFGHSPTANIDDGFFQTLVCNDQTLATLTSIESGIALGICDFHSVGPSQNALQSYFYHAGFELSSGTGGLRP